MMTKVQLNPKEHLQKMIVVEFLLDQKNPQCEK